jgi:DNA modification methylase
MPGDIQMQGLQNVACWTSGGQAMTPYYDHAGITIYHGDCREILPQLGRFDLLLTDPPYGINRANGMGGRGFDGFGKGIKRQPRAYLGDWDVERPEAETIKACVDGCNVSILWGGNYFADMLPVGKKWLVWDKCQTMPSFSDAELAWTSLDGTSVKMFRWNGSGLMAVEQNRSHPTQKPLGLFKWCLSLASDAQTVLDPFLGSGTTLVAAKAMGLRASGIEMHETYCEIAAKRLSQEVIDFK